MQSKSAFRIGFAATAIAAFAATGAIGACSDGGAFSEVGPDAGAGGTLGQDARTADPDGGNPMSTMRLAHLAPEVGPIDFCYQAARTGSFVGPVLSGGSRAPKPPAMDAEGGADAALGPNNDASADAASDASAGVASASYRSVSKYLNLEAAGPITMAIVAAGSPTCANAIVTGTVTLDPGKLSTVVITGAGKGSVTGTDDGGADAASDAGATSDASPLEISAFTDDRTTASDKMRVRVIHAALGTSSVASAGALGVRVTTTGSVTTVLTDRVEPRRASSPSQGIPVDGLGYATAAPMPPPTSITIGPASTDGGADAGFEPWQSAKAIDLDLRGGSLHTAFVLTGDRTSSFEVVWCADTTTTADQTTCIVVP